MMMTIRKINDDDDNKKQLMMMMTTKKRMMMTMTFKKLKMMTQQKMKQFDGQNICWRFKNMQKLHTLKKSK